MLMILIRYFWNPETVTVTDTDGIYDLSEIINSENNYISLAPGKAYYPNTYLLPENAGEAYPESIDRFPEIRAEYLSQRFILKLPDNNDIYTMTFKLSGRHAMRVYVNGRLAGQTGSPGTIKQDTEVWENNITFEAAAEDGKMDIILHSAHFYHAKRGASLAELILSKTGTMRDPFFFSRIKGIIVTGILLSAAIMLIGIYMLLWRTKETLYFAVACIAMMLRECLQSQAWIYFPIHGNLSFMLEYASLVLLTIFLSLYLEQYAVNKFLKCAQYTAIAGSLIYGICLLLTDSLFYTSVLKYYQVLLVLCIVPGISGVFINTRNPSKEQAAALYGIAVFFIASVSDIVMYSDILGDRADIPIAELSMLIFVPAQTVSLFLMNNRVLNEVREAEHKLEAEKSTLEKLNKMKTEFLGNVSHELKTPLTVVSGYAQTSKQLAEASRMGEGEEISRRMKLISSEAERLSLMVGQILDVTRMEEGRMAMERKPCYVDEIIHGAVGTHYPILNKNNNRLEIHIESGLPVVNADPARISQVVVNLISNAVRFTENGLITVSAEQKNSHIQICVSDTGEGVSPDRLEHIFERYGGMEKSGSRKDTGTGLGLYICKHIVEQHGGGIWAESAEGNGMRVFFTLPALSNQ